MKQKKYISISYLFCFTIIQFIAPYNLSASQKKLVIAHRGASGYLPEHTLGAAVMAYASGADFVELDVVMTKDGHLIVLHDLTLNATTDVEQVFPDRAGQAGKYQALYFTLAEIKRLRVHERSAKRGPGQAFPDRFPIGTQLFKVPTLEEMILLLKGLAKSHGRMMGLYIEIKGSDFHRKHNIDPAKALLERLDHHGYKDASDPIIIQSFDSEILKTLRYEHKTRLKLVQLIGENRWKLSTTDFTYIKTDKGMNEVSQYADGIGPWMNQVVTGVGFSGKANLTELVENARSYGLLIHPYTFRADRLPPYASSFQELLDVFFNEVKVDGIFTDFPDQVVDYLEKNSIN